MSRCVLTDTYSPTAIDSAPAASPAMPAVSTGPRSAVAAATPMTMPAVETIPSLAPKTAARSQLSLLATEPWCGCVLLRGASPGPGFDVMVEANPAADAADDLRQSDFLTRQGGLTSELTLQESDMSRIFLSHSSLDSREALALKRWLVDQEPPLATDIFLDIDPEVGLRPGERWKDRLQQASAKCEAVVCLLSSNWEASHECKTEYRVAENLNKQILCARLEPSAGDDLTSEWQRCDLFGESDMTSIDVGRRTSGDVRHQRLVPVTRRHPRDRHQRAFVRMAAARRRGSGSISRVGAIRTGRCRRVLRPGCGNRARAG